VLPDDEPSVDDPTIEESGLVGPSVVAQLLGGRVIEERDE
jgi:DNA polymerase-3 subunit gamma/tau